MLGSEMVSLHTSRKTFAEIGFIKATRGNEG